MEQKEKPFLLINTDTDEPHGDYDTREEAYAAVRYDRLLAYEIWKRGASGDVRIAACEPYHGNDDRVKQALGLPNASVCAQD